MASKSPDAFERSIKGITSVLSYIGVVLLAVLMFLGTADVFGRYVFTKPIIGTREIGEVILGSMVMLGWGSTQFVKGHVNVELFLVRFSPRGRAIANFVTTFMAFVLFALITWQAVLTARLYHEGGRLVYTIHWPLAPFQLLVSLGALVLCLVFILDMMKYVVQMKGRN